METDLLQLIWKIFANRFYMTGVSRLHAIDSRLHATEFKKGEYSSLPSIWPT